MYTIFLSVAFTVICCSTFAQTKKPDSTKKTVTAGAAHSPLIQEKVWPEPYSNFKNKGSVIIKPAIAFEIRTRL